MQIPVSILLGVSGVSTVLGAFQSVAGAAGGLASILGVVGGGGLAAQLGGGISLGAQLSALSRRTSDTVRDLVILRRGFEATGLGADAVTTATSRITQALLTRRDVVRQLGLSPEALLGLPTLQQMQALAAAFDRISSRSERARLATRLFGEKSGDLLQLFGAQGVFAHATRDAGAMAELLQQSAGQLDQLQQTSQLVQLRFREAAVILAEQWEPKLRAAAEALQAIGAGPLAAGALTLSAGAFLPIGSRFAAAIDTKMLDWATRAGPGLGIRLGNAVGGRFAGVFGKALNASIVGAVGLAVIEGWAIAQRHTQLQAAAAAHQAGDIFDEVFTVGAPGAAAALSGRIKQQLTTLTPLLEELRTTRSKLGDILTLDVTHNVQLAATGARVTALSNALLALSTDADSIIARNQAAAARQDELRAAGLDLLLGKDLLVRTKLTSGLHDRGPAEEIRDLEQLAAAMRRIAAASDDLDIGKILGAQNVDIGKLRAALAFSQDLFRIQMQIAELRRSDFERSTTKFFAQAVAESSSGARAAHALQQAFTGVTGAISDALTGVESLGDGLRETARQVLADLIRLTVQATILRSIAGLSPKFAAYVGISDAIAAHRAGGGVAMAGRAYIVGEKRPELFVPWTHGTILPSVSAATNAGPRTDAVVVHQHFESGITPQQLAALLPQLEARTRAGVLDAMRRRQDGF